MRLQHWILPLFLISFTPGFVEAGPILDWFTRKPKVDPVVRVPALITILKTDKEERNRTSAAEELASFDPKIFTDIYPTLIHILRNDPATGTRVAAANSLGKLRPISGDVGYALDQAASNDSAIRVRLAANSALLSYKLLGYTPGRNNDPKFDQSEEPPLAAPYERLLKTNPAKQIGQSPALNGAPLKESPKPATPVKNENKRESLFSLPSWLGGKDKEKEAVKPTIPVVPSNSTAVSPVQEPVLPPIILEPNKIDSIKVEPLKGEPLPASQGPSLGPPRE